MFWTYDHEGIPCREVVDVNPNTTKKGSAKRSSMLEKVADTLNKCAVPKFRADKRSVRDHVENLVYKRKKKLQAEEKATGITPTALIFSISEGISLFSTRKSVLLSTGSLFARENLSYAEWGKGRLLGLFASESRTNSSSPVISSIRHKQSRSWIFLNDAMATIFCERNAEESHW